MANAERDENSVPTLLAVSSADGVTPIVVWADPVTHRLLCQLIGGSTGYQALLTGSVNGSNTVFTWTTAPKAIVVDQGRVMQKTSSDGTVNWTGTTTTTLTIAPNFDIYAVA